MGYRSQVRCLIYGTPDDLDAFLIAQQIIFSSSVFNHFKQYLTRYAIKLTTHSDPRVDNIFHVLDLQGNDWKWYDDYDDVQAWYKFMEESLTFGLQYEFLRVGEGNGPQIDIDHQCSSNNHLLYTSQPVINEDIDRVDSGLIPLNI